MLVDLKDLLTVSEAANCVPVSEPTLRGWVNRGEIPCVRHGGHVFVHADDLRERFGRDFKPLHTS